MFGFIIWIFVSILVLWISKAYLSLNRHIAIAKTTGLPYIVSPINGIAGYLWTGIHDVVFNILKCLPYSQDWLYPRIMYLEPHRGWHYAQELRELHGEAYFIISPRQIYLHVGHAEAINQISVRRNHFLKPVEIYGVVDVFGKNILTTEKEEWKRHKKVIAPAFSEKSNVLVWKETIRQTNGMLRFWSRTNGSDDENLNVKNTAPDTAVLTLYVISGAAYGISQIWEGEDERQLGDNVVHGFNTAKLEGSHQLMFKNVLATFVNGIIWAALAPIWVYKFRDFTLAGHETTANTIHFIFLFLAISHASQEKLQSTLDTILSNRSSDSWNYESDFPALFNSFVGAVMNETLRVVPPAIDIPNTTREVQQLNIDGKIATIPAKANTYIHFNIVGAHRNPRYWPCRESKISDKAHDMDDFVPERWLPGYERNSKDKGSPDTSGEGQLFVPRKGAFIPFSEGARACPGKRFAQVEMMASLAVIFRVWSVELDVRGWASDEEIEGMGGEDRKAVYEKAIERARKLMGESESVITLQMVGEPVSLRFVKRGRERFRECVA